MNWKENRPRRTRLILHEKIPLTCLVLLAIALVRAQETKNYILEIDGDTVHIAPGEAIKFRSARGITHQLKLTKKEFLNYSDAFISFTYSSKYSVSTTKTDEDITQILLMSATGNGLMIQTYNSVNPELTVDFMLNEITQDDVNAGYKQTVTTTQKMLGYGTVLNGKKAVLTLDNETEEFICVANGKRKKGIMVVQMSANPGDAEAKKMGELFWKTLSVKY